MFTASSISWTPPSTSDNGHVKQRCSVVCGALLALALGAPPPAAQSATTGQVPDFKVEIWGSVLVDFGARMTEYAELRRTLAEGLPALVVTDDPVEILRAETGLASRIRRARAGAKRGDIFTRPIRDAFKRALAGALTAGICEAIGDDNPGEFFYDVNGTYPKNRPVSTVPPSVLAALPRLPDDVMYRFLDRDLILHDTRANIILDRIDDAFRCR